MNLRHHTDAELAASLTRLEVRIARARHPDDLETLNRAHDAVIAELVRRDLAAVERQEEER